MTDSVVLRCSQDPDTAASLRMPKFVTVFAVELKWWDHYRREVSFTSDVAVFSAVPFWGD